MREIKFRYWNGISKMMVNDPSVRADYKLGLNEYFTDRGWVWMQFTGLTDKNGKEIYEGDIIKNQNNNGFVYFIDGMYLVNYGIFDDILHKHNIVIGNIYQNPELLK